MTEIAVIVPTHDRADLLTFTLQSVLAQQGVDLVVAVVDDGSSDPRAVRAVVEALGDPRVRLLRHDSPRGVSAARNTGIASTSSEWLGFCDDDDVWAPEKLKAQLAAARSGAVGWAYTGHVWVDSELRIVDGAPPLLPRELVDAVEYYNSVPAGSSNVIVRRRVLDAVGSFDASLLSAEDWDLWIRLARHGLPAFVPEPLVGCRVHGVSITRDRRLMLAEVGIVARRQRVPVDWARHFRWAAWNSMLEGKRLEALSHYCHAIARGDLASIGRCAVALVYPGIARRRGGMSITDWTRRAEAWLGALRAAASAPRVVSPNSHRH
jgi:glycosyltransferase involved in cell wall biosynthesis